MTIDEARARFRPLTLHAPAPSYREPMFFVPTSSSNPFTSQPFSNPFTPRRRGNDFPPRDPSPSADRRVPSPESRAGSSHSYNVPSPPPRPETFNSYRVPSPLYLNQRPKGQRDTSKDKARPLGFPNPNRPHRLLLFVVLHSNLTESPSTTETSHVLMLGNLHIRGLKVDICPLQTELNTLHLEVIYQRD
jgi:hypothetical protein